MDAADEEGCRQMHTLSKVQQMRRGAADEEGCRQMHTSSQMQQRRRDADRFIFGEAPLMGHEPLGLLASGKVHTWLPWPTLRTRHPGNLATLPNKTAWQPCSVKGAWEALAGAAETFATSFAGTSWPEPAGPLPTLKLGMLAEQTFLPGQPSLGDLGCSGQTRPPQAPGTASVNTNFISILLWMAFAGLESGGARSRDFAVHLQTTPACR
eukprot:1139900-Pelagomonas_calceolata.AAC.9